jgi:hypothetical protein
MSYRDDLEAMAARVSALEAQLAEAEQGQDSQRGRAEKLEASLRQSKIELEMLRAKLPPEPAQAAAPPVNEPGPNVPIKGKAGGVAVASIFVLIAVGLFVGVAAQKKTKLANPMCTLDAFPVGAQLFVVRTAKPLLPADKLPESLRETMGKDVEIDSFVGTTPLTLSREEWIMHGVVGNVQRFELRADGYETQVVSTPLAGMGCSKERTITLRRR